MEGGRQPADEGAEVRLAGVGHFFKVNDNAGLVRFHCVFDNVPCEILASRGARKQLSHFLDAPRHAVVIVHETHHGQLDGGIQRLHPLVQLVVLQQRDSFRRRGFDGVLPVFVIHDRQRAIRRDRMQLLGNQKVNVLVMFLQGSEAVGIPAHEKRRAQWIVTRRHGSDIRHASMPAFSHGHRLLFRFQGAVCGLAVRQQSGGQLHADGNGHEKICQQ